jgi:hypothetical protein
MKQNPKAFWKLLKQGSTEAAALKPKELAEYNKRLFYNADAKDDAYQPIASPDASYITTEELQSVLSHKYKATKSRGGSSLPP